MIATRAYSIDGRYLLPVRVRSNCGKWPIHMNDDLGYLRLRAISGACFTHDLYSTVDICSFYDHYFLFTERQRLKMF